MKSTKCWPGRFFEISQFDRRPDSSVAGSPRSLTVGPRLWHPFFKGFFERLSLAYATTAQIQALPLEQLEALADALLDFQGPADLATWLAANG